MTTAGVPNIEKRAAQYVALRDMINAKTKQHEEELKKPKETLMKLNAAILAHLNALNAESVKTAAGTVSKSIKKSASLADKSAFWTFVVATGDFDLLDYKANAVEVERFINDPANGGHAPPGVNFTKVEVVGVRRPSGT